MNKRQEATIAIKILSNSNRFSIISLLSKENKDFCVNEIAKKVGISQSLASHQLAYLEARGLVTSIRMGQSICYILEDSSTTKAVIRVIKTLN